MEKIFTSLKWLVHEFLVLKSNFDLVGGKFVGCCIVACSKFQKIYLHESKPLNMSCKRPYFEKNQL